MRTSADILQFGLSKLAEEGQKEPRLPIAVTPDVMQQMMMEEARRRSASGGLGNFLAVHNPVQAPTQHQRDFINSYAKSAIVGALIGTSTGALLGKLVWNDALRHALLGGASGLTGALVRHYDQNSDPPGLNPVYTFPAGARLGGASGGIAGALLGNLSNTGAMKGALTGALSGGLSGAAISSLI